MQGMFSNLWEIAKIVLTSTIVLGAVAAAIRMYIDYRLKERLDEQREFLKGFLATDLERAKHSLKLEESRLTFVYENQRVSFTNVVRAMHAAITAIEAAFDYANEEWRSVDEDVLADFRAVRVSESLYTGSNGDRALTVFEGLLSGCVLDRMDGSPIESDLIRENRAQLAFIALRIQEFFRVRLGIASGDPLLDVFRLEAFSMINTIHLHEEGFPTKGIFKRTDHLTPEETVDLCKGNGAALVDELLRLEATLKKDSHARFFYKYQDQARTCRELLSRSTPP
jgi:hypothetical protein